MSGNILNIDIQNGQSVDVDLSQFMDNVDTNTDNQNVTKFELQGNSLVLELERGNSVSVPLDLFNNSGSDNQI